MPKKISLNQRFTAAQSDTTARLIIKRLITPDNLHDIVSLHGLAAENQCLAGAYLGTVSAMSAVAALINELTPAVD